MFPTTKVGTLRINRNRGDEAKKVENSSGKTVVEKKGEPRRYGVVEKEVMENVM